MNKTLTGLMTTAALASTISGCATMPITESVPTSPKPVSSQSYSSPVVSSEWGYKTIDVKGNVDETNPICEKDGLVSIVGFSGPFATEQFARDDAGRNAASTASRFTENGFIRGIKAKSHEIRRVVGPTGEVGYIVESEYVMMSPIKR